MKRREIKKKKPNGAPGWMVTYSDMVTLILVFFILLFAMSQVDLEKFQAISQSFQGRTILDNHTSAVPLENDHEKEKASEAEKRDPMDRLMIEVEQFLEENGLNDVVSANRTKEGVALVLQENFLFESGKANVLASGKPFLNKIGSLLKKMDNHVEVQGHTDDRPIDNYRFPSNWELSAARASSVIRYLIEQEHLNPKRFTAIGYADTMPKVPNDSAENWRKNRRVEIVILKKAST